MKLAKIFVCHHKPLFERKKILEDYFFENDIDVEWVEKFLPEEIDQFTCRISGECTIPEFSLYLKHEYCLQQQVINKYPLILVLEDDVDLPFDFKNQIDNYIDEFLNYEFKLDILMLGSCCNLEVKNISKNKLIYFSETYKTRCTHAMIFTLDASIKIVPHLSNVTYPIDHRLNQIIQNQNLKIAWAEPPISQKTDLKIFNSSIK